MTDQKKESVDTAGSSVNEEVIKADPAKDNLEGESVTPDPTTEPKTDDKGSTDAGTKGKSEKVDLNKFVEKKQYDEAEKKIGTQGTELGEYRTFFKEVQPLLDKLQGQPGLVEAIMQGRFEPKLVEAILDDKVTIQEATTVAEAHKDVKQSLGAKKYESTSKEDLEKMISDKISEGIKKETDGIKTNIKSNDERRDFESKVNNFVKNTPDFSEHAKEIQKWLEEHPDQYEIELAYEIVKGRKLVAKAAKEEEINQGEAAKALASNAPGGSSQGGIIVQDQNMVDKLIGNHSNPNVI